MPAAFEGVRGDVEVLVLQHGEARQHRVAMVAVLVLGVLAVRDLLPRGVGDELVLRPDGPFAVAHGVPLVRAHHLLQEQHVHGEPVQALLQLVDDHPPAGLGETLVDVVGGDREAHGKDRLDGRPFYRSASRLTGCVRFRAVAGTEAASAEPFGRAHAAGQDRAGATTAPTSRAPTRSSA
jgi:hypothetical protein